MARKVIDISLSHQGKGTIGALIISFFKSATEIAAQSLLSNERTVILITIAEIDH